MGSRQGARRQRVASADAVTPVGSSSGRREPVARTHTPARGRPPFCRTGLEAQDVAALLLLRTELQGLWLQRPRRRPLCGLHPRRPASEHTSPPCAPARPAQPGSSPTRPDTDLDATSWQACPDVFSFRTRSFLRASERGRRGPSAASHSMPVVPAPTGWLHFTPCPECFDPRTCPRTCSGSTCGESE